MGDRSEAARKAWATRRGQRKRGHRGFLPWGYVYAKVRGRWIFQTTGSTEDECRKIARERADRYGTIYTYLPLKRCHGFTLTRRTGPLVRPNRATHTAHNLRGDR